MSDKGRLLALAGLLGAGIALAIALYLGRVETPLESTLAPVFELLGTPTKVLDRLAARVVPVGELDERDLGLLLRSRYEAKVDATEPDFVYVNDLIHHLEEFTHKPFDYRVFLIDAGAPNAMALPGGVILVTRPLLATVRSESELVSILAHELGHVERGHCFDAVKFELLARKLGGETLGKIADIAVRLLVGHSFRKAQENDADEYAYTLILYSPYDPRGLGNSFGSLLEYQRSASGRGSPQHANPIRDYFLSHPPLELRQAKFTARADAWWRRHPDAERHVGSESLRSRTSYYASTEAVEGSTSAPR